MKQYRNGDCVVANNSLWGSQSVLKLCDLQRCSAVAPHAGPPHAAQQHKEYSLHTYGGLWFLSCLPLNKPENPQRLHNVTKNKFWASLWGLQESPPGRSQHLTGIFLEEDNCVASHKNWDADYFIWLTRFVCFFLCVTKITSEITSLMPYLYRKNDVEILFAQSVDTKCVSEIIYNRRQW
jgi:hypothetical protein